MKTWFRRTFVVIDIEEARERNLTFVCNIYGDLINLYNCRSLWEDDKGRVWSVKQLNKDVWYAKDAEYEQG